jgi:hypothetical protein
MIEVNGESISNEEAAGLVKMLFNDAKQMAGEFHGMERSIKFRTNWPDEDEFAKSEWRNFVEATIQLYIQKLGDPHTSPADKRRLHLAIVLNAMTAKDQPQDNRLQLAPNTQQFVGDKYENRKIAEKFGNMPNYRAALKRSTAHLLH